MAPPFLDPPLTRRLFVYEAFPADDLRRERVRRRDREGLAEGVDELGPGLRGGRGLGAAIEWFTRHNRQEAWAREANIGNYLRAHPEVRDLIVSGDLDLSGHRYDSLDPNTRKTGVYGSGEPGMLTLRAGGDPILTPPLREALLERVGRREQALLLLNRRGFAMFLDLPPYGARDVLAPLLALRPSAELIAVIGYGIQGKAQAANMRDSGMEVIVGTRGPEQSRSRAEAEADGAAVTAGGTPPPGGSGSGRGSGGRRRWRLPSSRWSCA